MSDAALDLFRLHVECRGGVPVDDTAPSTGNWPPPV